MESEQADGPVSAPLQLDNSARGPDAPASPDTNAEGAKEKEKPVSSKTRAARITIGPAEKSVPGRKKDLGRVDVPEAQPGKVAPIRMPNSRPTVQPLGSPAAVASDAPGMRAPAARATFKRRHKFTLYTFILFVLIPVALLAGYLFAFAQDQYASEAGFSVRKEEGATSFDGIGGLTQVMGSASTDAEILYDFILSPDLVTRIDQDYDLYKVFGRNYDRDPLFSLPANSTIEEKESYWQRMVTVEYNEATGLIRLEVKAFSAEEAQKLGRAVIEYSSQMINRLSDAAREDATRYARTELEKAVEELKTTRANITEFRSKIQMIDPIQEFEGQLRLMSELESELAQTKIQLETLQATVTAASSPQINQTKLQIELIQKQLDEKRARIGLRSDGSSAPESLAQTVAEYERLIVEKEVAEERFRSTTILFNTAEAEANRKSRYLAAHVEPTLAEGAVYPQFALLLLMTGFFLTLAWALGILIYYSIRDRR